MDGAGLHCQLVPAFELQLLVAFPDLGECLIDVHGGLAGPSAGRVPLTPAVLVQRPCDEERQVEAEQATVAKVEMEERQTAEMSVKHQQLASGQHCVCVYVCVL